VRERILDFYATSVCGGTTPSAKQIIDYVRNNYTVKQYMLYDLFEDFLRIEQGRVGYEVEETTLYKYRLVVNRLKEAIPDKPLKQVNNADILTFKNLLQTKVKLGHNTLCAYMTRAKSIFIYALDNNLIEQNPLKNIRIRKEEVEITPLTKEELEIIRQHNFNIPRLEQVRDCFVFAANTAMAYADLASVDKKDIREQDGVYYIKKNRVKTGVEYVIPLNDTALEILRKYDYKLPVLTNQKYNAYLKEIADLCGINKRLTTHLARHTAATLMLNAGISMDVVAKILGHSNTTMTAHYAKMMDRTIILTKIEF
jgi:integrase